MGTLLVEDNSEGVGDFMDSFFGKRNHDNRFTYTEFMEFTPQQSVDNRTMYFQFLFPSRDQVVYMIADTILELHVKITTLDGLNVPPNNANVGMCNCRKCVNAYTQPYTSFSPQDQSTIACLACSKVYALV